MPALADMDLTTSLAPDERWWPGVAQRVCELACEAPGCAAGDFRRVTVILPAMVHARALRQALLARLGAPCVGPRLHTLQSWTGIAARAAARPRAELYQALRDSTWVRDGFGSQANTLWSLARDVTLLNEELTLAACGAIEAFTGRWRGAVARNFSQRAAAAGDAQSQLVLGLWQASLAFDEGAPRLREALERCARTNDGPLLWLLPQGALPWQRAAVAAIAAASGQQARIVVADYAALGERRPWISAAWPELHADALGMAAAPIAQRAGALSQCSWQASELQIFACDSLEQEASTAAQWLIDRLSAGDTALALVALDRLTARRVRALLDRARVLVADESGWKLSTTSAAAAVMRWIDLVVADFDQRDLEDWLRSPFTLAQSPEKEAILQCVTERLRQHGVRGGMNAVRMAVARGPDIAGAAPATRTVDQMVDLAQRWQRPGTLGRYLGLLSFTLEALGMRAALAADPVGRIVLEALRDLHEELIGSDLPLKLDEFRAFLAEHLEDLAAVDREIDSPVVMTTLAALRLRRFDAVILIGADADHLPATGSGTGLLANCVRQDLGLRTEADRVLEQTRDLACALAGSPRLAATWRVRRQDEPLPLSPLLDRLCLLSELAGGPRMLAAARLQDHVAVPAIAPAPCPRAPSRLPARLSASAYQDLIDCPYRFYALRILGLRELPRMRARPDKRDLGLLLHAILCAFHEQHAEGLSEMAAYAQLLRIVDAQVSPLLTQQPALIAYRQRLRAMLPGYLRWFVQSQRDGWRWLEGESPRRRALELEGAGTVELVGRIDRIDANAQGQLRLLDYKVRDVAALRKGQREVGEDVQLLFYAMLLDPLPQEAAYLSLQRPPDPLAPQKGVVTLVPAPAPLAGHVAQMGARLAQDLQRIHGGAGLPANGAETICRRCELPGLCRHGYSGPVQQDEGLLP